MTGMRTKLSALLSKEEPMTIRTNTPNLLDNPPSD